MYVCFNDCQLSLITYLCMYIYIYIELFNHAKHGGQYFWPLQKWWTLCWWLVHYANFSENDTWHGNQWYTPLTNFSCILWELVEWGARFFFSVNGGTATTILHILQGFRCSHPWWKSQSLTGWWYTYSSENMSSSVGIMTFRMYGKMKFMFQTTNQ